MEKKKYDLSKYTEMHDEVQVEGKDGTVVTVRTHIPYKDKLELAQEWAGQTVMTHDDSCVYTSHEGDLYERYEIAKYYTDIDTTDVSPEEVSDFLINNELWGKIKDALGRDYDECWSLYWNISEEFRTTFEDDRSLAKAVRTSFGFLFNGEDLTESMAKAEATKDVMVNALTALQAKEKEESTKLADGGKLKVNGNILQFGKRDI